MSRHLFQQELWVSLPVFSILDPKHDAAVTVLQNFEDKIIKMNMASDEDGTLTFPVTTYGWEKEENGGSASS